MKTYSKNLKENMIEKEIDEASAQTLDDLIKLVSGGIHSMPGLKGSLEDVMKFAKNENKALKYARGGEIKNVDDLVNALRTGAMSGKEVGKLYSGLMKSPSTPSEIINTIARDLVGDATFIRKYAQYGGDFRNLEKELGKAQYSAKARKRILQYAKQDVKFNKAVERVTGKPLNQGGKLTTQTGKPTVKKTKVSNPGKVKAWVKKHKTATILGSLAVLGGGGLVAYFATKGENTPEDQSSATELEQILSSFPPCVLKLKDRLEIVTGTDSGTVALLMRQTGVPEYDRAGGIYLYSNGRIILFDNTKRGNYTCKDIESLQESLKMMSIIKNIITEQSSNEISQEQMGNYIDTVVDDLDGWVAVYNLESIKNVLTALKGKTYKGKSALEAFKGFYYRDEKANLIDDINKVGVRTLGVKGMELKDEVVALASGSSAVPSARSSAGGVNDVLNITWDRQGGTGSSAAGGVGRKTVRYRNCKEGRYTKGCYNKTTIPQVQRCLGLDPDGKFWTLTQQALENIGYSNGFTDEDIPKICKTSSQENQRAQIEPMSQPPGTFSQQKPEVDTQNMNLTGKLGV